MMKSMMMTWPDVMCQFCYSNGENLEQCRSHHLKSPTGLVSCPILRAFTCPTVRLFTDCSASLLHIKIFNKIKFLYCNFALFSVELLETTPTPRGTAPPTRTGPPAAAS